MRSYEGQGARQVVDGDRATGRGDGIAHGGDASAESRARLVRLLITMAVVWTVLSLAVALAGCSSSPPPPPPRVPSTGARALDAVAVALQPDAGQYVPARVRVLSGVSIAAGATPPSR